MRFAVRLAVVIVLALALCGLAVHYGATYDEQWPHPSGDQLQAEYDASVGEQVLLFGTVHEHDSETGPTVIHVTDSADTIAAELEVTGITDPVEPGGVVQVYGVLEADRTMDADQFVVVDDGPTATTYKLITSVIGVIFAVGYFLRYWRLSLAELGFEPRTHVSSQSAGQSTDSSSTEVTDDG
ncbi:hypothetical protein [Natronolimnobius baerhuensis]|uniref:DNA-binding protein n=1 Tax=Natronolimnobius baerhuensis TaxID=253108 RepID=A0A202E884_9EURY|nr:hypothetical protein [Natronolimnobius baerhuensis]OVE84439.1 DNA-binding protein [Natronolimnobius baerhuensis]